MYVICIKKLYDQMQCNEGDQHPQLKYVIILDLSQSCLISQVTLRFQCEHSTFLSGNQDYIHDNSSSVVCPN
jgi:hypothetical protein